MKRTLLFFCLICLSSITAFAQTINNPVVGRADDENCAITKIETTKDFTIVSFEYIATSDNAWAQLNKEIYIKTDLSDKHYKYIKSEGISMAPDRKELANAGDKLAFKAYFQKVPKTANSIDVIEKEDGNNSGAVYFNYYDVSLTKSHGKVVTRVALTPPPIDKVIRGNSMVGGDMAGMMGAMGPVFGNMAKSMMDAQLEYYKQPGKIAEIAKLNRQYFDALVTEGFTQDQALKIITSESLLPKAAMSGK
ncbi:MAG: hypothetical protein V4553_21050 [Bacteroidota bacterium]